jgi:hypothetical protein
MSERRKIEETLRKKEQEIQGLEEKIKNAKVYVKALRDVLKMLDKGSEPEVTESTLRQGSAVDQARDVIMGQGAPVHIGEMLEAMGKPQTREARSSLASSLAAYVRRQEIFVRTAPNTFGLIELGHNGDGDEIPAEPPVGFGQVSAPTNPQTMPDEDEDMPF